MRAGHRRSVGSYLVLGFALWCATVVALIAVNARTSYQQERENTLDLLALAAEAGADAADPVVDESVATLEDLATSSDISSLTKTGCEVGLAPLRTATDAVHMHVLSATGAEICSLRGKEAGSQPLALGRWFDQALAGEVVVSDVEHDPIGDQPGMRVAIPLAGEGGRKGVLVAVLWTGRPALDVPQAVPRSGVLIVVDPKSGVVVNRSPNAPLELGAPVKGTGLERSLRDGGVVDVQGDRYFVETTTASTDWRVLAGLDKSAALAPAERAVRYSMLVGLASLLLIGALSLYIHRRLARPIQLVGGAIESSWHGNTVTLAPMTGPREVARVAEVFNDLIVERAAREDDLRHRATHDVLTGLRNRAGAKDALEAAAQTRGAVLYLDLDRFKLVNDSHGHTVGDAVLHELAARLVAVAGPGTTVARFGGDEFLIVVTDAPEDSEVFALADRLCAELSRPIHHDDLTLYLRGSVGIAHATPDASPEMLVRDADTAMYRAKAAGVGWTVYDDAMGASVRRRLELESALHGAVERGELELHFQPIVQLGAHNGTVAGAEALLRWTHPALGEVSPYEFIPIAEESGLIVPIGAWVLDQAIATAAGWARTGRPIPVSVNVAAVQFVADGLTERILELLERHRLPAQCLMVEVTESTMINTSEAMATLRDLRNRGVGVALDDFGTGFSSLSYLEQMPATELKIDQSFVSSMSDDGTRRIIGALVRLAAELDLVTVAEGVETIDQADALVAAGCPLAQGYLYAPPMPLADFDRYVAARDASGPKVPLTTEVEADEVDQAVGAEGFEPPTSSL